MSHLVRSHLLPPAYLGQVRSKCLRAAGLGLEMSAKVVHVHQHVHPVSGGPDCNPKKTRGGQRLARAPSANLGE